MEKREMLYEAPEMTFLVIGSINECLGNSIEDAGEDNYGQF